MATLKKWLFLLILLVFGVSLVSVVVRVYRINGELAQKTKVLEEKKREEARVVSLSEYLKSDEFIEGEIRDKLGYTREGEVLLILPPNEVLLKLVNLNWEIEGDIQKPVPNWKKWYETFFKES
ncbi:MAG: hypothetical protein A2427_04920 [Candidatus Nealsonbacteria bacterium RIFOXYC1_FULL_40_7]|uniref:Septum formation initiator n=1 Tax=Candidatus Nealsonbacteria bacterium RIFOXYC1_FULL_40_7 TaxID=1801678 RepID=A0A1G2EQ87_9BACT|nr:MAG: hypothetical protein A2427_04920 [Candidatus Nealsonbacteria bacterium RIFOXYC1_FULL_40_7]